MEFLNILLGTISSICQSKQYNKPLCIYHPALSITSILTFCQPYFICPPFLGGNILKQIPDIMTFHLWFLKSVFLTDDIFVLCNHMPLPQLTISRIIGFITF